MRRIGISIGMIFLIIMVTILPSAPLPASAQTFAAGANRQAFYVEWSITAEGSADTTRVLRTIEHEKQTIRGSAIVQPRDNLITETSWSAYVSQYKQEVIREYESTQVATCFTSYYRSMITDPTRWSGTGPNQFSKHPDWIMITLPKNENGIWTMDEPHELTESAEQYNFGTYLNVISTGVEGCPSGYSRTGAFESAAHIFGEKHTMTGDAEGKRFTMTDSFVKDGSGEIKLNVMREITVVRLDGCFLQAPPIDINNPAVKTVDVQLTADKTSIPPNDVNGQQAQATLTAKVTCGGVPVKNAQVQVSVNVLANSGGHTHGDTTNPRPRGYLRVPGQSWVEITAARPAVTVTTDAAGQAKVNFKPGTDYFQHTRGIAGTYEVTAKPVKFPTKQVKRAIEVERTDFVELPVPDQNYFINRGNGTAQHPDGAWGTQATINGVSNLAQDFVNAQIAHNMVLTQSGQAPWPIYPLSVNDITLQHGGLYDTGGWNVVTNQPAGFVAWQPPHQTHLNGIGVDLNTRQWNPPNRYNWLRATLVSLGHNYGNWANEPTLHLNYQNTNHLLDRGTSAANADLGVSVFLSNGDPDMRMTTAPGQVLSYTVAVDNLNGGASAPGSVLTVSLPSGMSFLSATPAPTRNANTRQPVWDLGTLSAGQSPQMVEVRVQVDPAVAAGTTLSVTAQASLAGNETRLDNNTDQSFGLLVKGSGPDLVAVSDLTTVPMTLGQPVTVTLGIVNAGNASAPNASLTLKLPVSVTIQTAGPTMPVSDNGSWTWTLGTLQPDESKVVSVTLKLDGSLAQKLVVDPSTKLTYTVTANTTGDTEPSNNIEQTVKSIEFAGSDVAVWISADGVGEDGSLPSGQDLTYTIRYANLGNQIAPSTTVTLSLGSGVSFVNAQPSATKVTTSTVFAGGVAAWNLGTLAVGESGSISMRVHTGQVPQDGTPVLAAITSAAADNDPSNNTMQDWWQAAVVQTPSFQTLVPVVLRSHAAGW